MRLTCFCRRSCLLAGALVLASLASAQTTVTIPTAKEVKALLAKEPITAATWPAWRQRLLDWIGDRSQQTDAAYLAVTMFMKDQANANGDLTGDLGRDALAWYFLGSYYLWEAPKAEARESAAKKAEACLRRSLALDDKFARAHRNLALALIFQGGDGVGFQSIPAREALNTAAKLDPKLPLAEHFAELALREGQPREAEAILQKEWAAGNKDRGLAIRWSGIIIGQKDFVGSRSAKIGTFVQVFPDDGVLASLHGMALAMDDQLRQAAAEFQRARGLGVNPETVIPAEIVRRIEEEAAPGLLEKFFWVLLFFAIFYAGVMALMALAGLVLAGRTRGAEARQLMQADEPVVPGPVTRAAGETGLARVYGFVLFLGLILFYLSIPFVILGLIALTWGSLLLIFQMRRIPVKLVVIVAVVGLGGAWAVLKSVFSRPASGAFGLPKTAAECPRVHALLDEVAQRVNTDPIREVYIAPGAAIGVHQEGRGPFGMFGVKRRVLTLGLSTMRYLTVGELQAILAHEYAHFSHSDTFYSRFIYQVHLSIDQALYGMGSTGGLATYINPFYWFLFLYYKCYSLLSAGYSRSREFLADRLACSLYGSDVFSQGLIKVTTDGTLFEKTMYDNIANLLTEQKAFVNMYESFQEFRDKQLSLEEREKLYRELLEEKGSLFASHPTIGERLRAAEGWPKARNPNTAPALSLFDSAEEIEKELTVFLTDYMAYMQHLQAQAAASG